jgi:hypothetical protein
MAEYRKEDIFVKISDNVFPTSMFKEKYANQNYLQNAYPSQMAHTFAQLTINVPPPVSYRFRSGPSGRA